jgi:DNA-binding response OmpR family regulator
MIVMTTPQYRRHECTVDGLTVRLSAAKTEFLATLLLCHPERFLSISELIEASWPDPDFEPDYAGNIIAHWIEHLRLIGIPVENYWGFGWRIPAHARSEFGEVLVNEISPRLAA